ncbi:GNAT family N-acetyltransferase [Endobacterium cereale]
MADTVADRIWREWWRDVSTVDHVKSKVQDTMRGRAFPFTLVAVKNGFFLGAVSVVESNTGPRRDLSPWLSGLWVEETERRKGTGSLLIAEAIRRTERLGRTPLYLTATDDGMQFYMRRGWTVVQAPGEYVHVLSSSASS